MQVQTPPQWRQIRAATPSPPHRERSASPPASKEKDGRRGYNDQEYNQAHMRIGRGDTGCPSRPHRDRSADGPERQAASRQDRFGGQHDFRPNQPKGDGYWRRLVHSTKIVLLSRLPRNRFDRTREPRYLASLSQAPVVLAPYEFVMHDTLRRVVLQPPREAMNLVFEMYPTCLKTRKLKTRKFSNIDSRNTCRFRSLSGVTARRFGTACQSTRTSSPDWQRDTQRHANHIPLEGHHDHRGPETPCFSSGSDRYGRGAIAKKIQVSWDEEGREKDRGFEQYADHNSRDDGGDWARHEGDRDQYSSAASGRFGLSYNQVDSEPSYLLQRSPRSEHQAREPLDSGSGTSSDRRSRGSDKTSHTGDRRGKGKRVELSNGLGRRQTAQKVRPVQQQRDRALG